MRHATIAWLFLFMGVTAGITEETAAAAPPAAVRTRDHSINRFFSSPQEYGVHTQSPHRPAP